MDTELISDTNHNLSPKKSQKINQVETDLLKVTRPIIVMTKLPDLDVTQDLVLSPTIVVHNPNAELLGSVTTFTPKQGPESGQTVRTSARVIQKLKQDSIRPLTPPPNDKKEASGKDDRAAPKTPNQPKTNRSVWSNTEKNYFFEALNEYGKDFDSIALYINTRAKRINLPNVQAKSREQVRLFYYQSYQKVSKYLKFSEDVKKLAQELYALINYGEMRKKLTFVNEKYFFKLRDLVYKGLVTIRTKGKNVKIRTPSCKALRQLNQLEEWQEDIKLPTRVEIFLKPINIETWGKVQNLAQNPRVKMILPIQRRVSIVIKTLQMKWRNQENRLCDRFVNVQLQTQTKKKISNSGDDLLLPSPPKLIEPKIHILPPQCAIIHRPMVSLGTFLSSRRICLNSYEERIGVKVRGETLCSERINSIKEMMKGSTKRQRHDSNSEKKSPDVKKIKSDSDGGGSDASPPLSIVKPDIKTDSLDSIKIESDSERDRESTDGELLSLPGTSKSQSLTKITKRKENKNSTRQKKENFRPLISPETQRKIREGWTLDTIGDMTIGDLYIMFGNDLRLNLEYQFVENGEKCSTGVELRSSIEIRTSTSTTSLTFTGCGSPSTSTSNTLKLEKNENDQASTNLLGNKLKQILTVAHMMEQKKNVNGCVCGHVCDKIVKDESTPTTSFISTKSHFGSPLDNSVFRSPATLPIRNNCNLSIIDQYKHHVNNLRVKQQQRWQKFRNRPVFNKQIQRVVIPPTVPIPSSRLPSIIKPVAKFMKPNISPPKSNNLNKEMKEDIQDTSKSNGTQSIMSNNNDISKNAGPYDTNNQFKSIWNDLNNGNNMAGTSTEIGTNSNGNNDNNMEKNGTPLDDDDSLGFATLDSQSTFLRNINENSGIKCLMEISLPSPVQFEKTTTNNTNGEKLEVPNSTPPMSPLTMIKDFVESSDNTEWLSPDHMNDFSFSSFLGHLDNMAASNGDDSLQNKCRPPSQNAMDCSNLSVISETTVDYMTKFEQIAAELQEKNVEETVNFP